MGTLHRSLFAYQQKIAESMDDLYLMIGLAYEGFMKHRRSRLQEAENLGKKVRHFEKTFGEEIVKEAGKEGARTLIALPGHVVRVADCLDAVIRAVRTKIAEGTLFSDKAVSEVAYVFTTVKEMLQNSRDAVLTENRVLTEHVSNANEKLSQAVRDYTTAHEERLIKGLCSSSHSAIYLEMMDSLRSAGWHLREIVGKLEGQA